MKDKKIYKHFIITRFNIKCNFGCKLRNPENNPMKRILDVDYLEERFAIFEKYTLPSIKKQTNQNFVWIILFHKKTPSKFLKRIKELKCKFDFVDLYFDEEEKFCFSEYCNNNGEVNDFFITTRIDNDDMLGEDYISKIQEYANENLHTCILSFEKGLKYELSSQKKYLYNEKCNHFISMISPKEEYILQYNHSKILDSGKEIVMLNTNKPMWIEVIHNSNVINQIRDEDLEK